MQVYIIMIKFIEYMTFLEQQLNTSFFIIKNIIYRYDSIKYINI